jgi:hypothetical protein
MGLEKNINVGSGFITATKDNLNIFGEKRGGKESERHIYMGAKHTFVAGDM